MAVSMIKIKSLSNQDLSEDFLHGFNHRQRITAEWKKVDNAWITVETDVRREWDVEKRKWIPDYLKEQIDQGGVALGAFHGDRLVGFASVDGVLLGERAKYANLTMLFVDDEYKRKGIGRSLFCGIKKAACELNADKLFISAISSVDTIAFYFSMGCLDAEEIMPDFVDTEEDRYLECPLCSYTADRQDLQ